MRRDVTVTMIFAMSYQKSATKPPEPVQEKGPHLSVRAAGVRLRTAYLPQQAAPGLQQELSAAQQSFAWDLALEKPVAARAARASTARMIREFFMI